jgi:uncharacterized membrane protein
MMDLLQDCDGLGALVVPFFSPIRILSSDGCLYGVPVFSGCPFGESFMNRIQLFESALACAVALGAASVTPLALAASGQMQMTPEMIKAQQEKTMKMMKADHYSACYGVNAAYKNDCQSPGHSCAGQDSKASDPQAFVAMPAGLCTKIAGGSLTKA